MNATFKTVMLWMSLLVVVFLAWHFAQFQKKETPVKFSEFMAQVDAGQVADVTITGNEVKGHTVSREAFRTFAPIGLRQADGHAAREEGAGQLPARPDADLGQHAHLLGALPAADRLLDLLHAPDAERRQQGALVRQVQGQAARQPAEEGDLQGRGGRRGGEERAAGDHRVPARAAEVPEAGRPDPEGRAADGPAGLGQDAPRARDRRRGERALLLDLGLGLRRDVRGRRRLPRARPLRAGQEERPLHHLHRRDRRRRPPPRGRARRRPRRARADAERPPRRDGRLREQRRCDPDRGHEPAGRARPGALAPGPLRPARRRLAPRRARPRGHPAGAHPQDPARGGRRPLRARALDARLLGRGPREPGERGGADGRPGQPEVRLDERFRVLEGQGADGRRAAEPDHHRRGEEDHGLPRGRPRAAGVASWRTRTPSTR